MSQGAEHAERAAEHREASPGERIQACELDERVPGRRGGAERGGEDDPIEGSRSPRPRARGEVHRGGGHGGAQPGGALRRPPYAEPGIGRGHGGGRRGCHVDQDRTAQGILPRQRSEARERACDPPARPFARQRRELRHEPNGCQRQRSGDQQRDLGHLELLCRSAEEERGDHREQREENGLDGRASRNGWSGHDRSAREITSGLTGRTAAAGRNRVVAQTRYHVPSDTVPQEAPMLLWARAAIVSSILLFVPYMLEQFDHPKAVAVRVLGGGALAAAAAALGRRRNGQAPRWVPLDGALLAWLVVEVAATIASRAPHLSVWGDYEQHEGLLTSVGVFGIYVAARLGTRSPADAERTLRWLVGAAAVSGAYALLVQASGLDQLVWTRTALYSEGRFVRPFGTMGHPNLLGVTTAASLAIAVSMTVLARRGRPWWVGAAILLGVVTGVTLSRGAWLGGAAGVLVARWAAVRADAEPGRNRRLLAMIGLASLLAAVVVATVPIFRNRFFELLTPTSGPSRSRLEIWKTALAMWRAHPWLGVGPGAFMLLFERYQTAGFWRLEWATIHFHAHSIYLHTLATRGLAGLAVSLAAAVALGHGLWAGWRRGLPVRAALAPILAALTAVAVAGAFGVLGNAGAAEVAALLGTAAALAATPVTVATDVATVESATEERRPARVRRPRSRRRVTGSPVTPMRWGTPGWIGVAVALLAMIPQLGGLLGSRAAAYGRDFVSSVSVDGGTAQRMLDRAVRLDPGNDYIW